jgi:hypothetical protein
VVKKKPIKKTKDLKGQTLLKPNTFFFTSGEPESVLGILLGSILIAAS